MIKQILSVQHPLVKHLVKLKQDRSYRYEQQSVVVEGIKPIQELIRSSDIKALFVDAEEKIPSLVSVEKIYLVNDAVMKKISSMQSSEGIAAEMTMPLPTSFKGLKYIVAFDEINDPGNLGTLIRSALALGWDGAYLLPGCCDPFNDKAIRAGRGAQFRLPIQFGTFSELKGLCKDYSWIPLVADLHGAPPSPMPKDKGCLLVLGNEARGPSDDILSFCRPITIPMEGKMESLNVAIAGSILIYLLKN